MNGQNGQNRKNSPSAKGKAAGGNLQNASGGLTSGGVFSTLVRFTIPFLVSNFLQTFYGLADLLIIGMFRGAESTTAVADGSQVMHMLTVMIIGLSMGSTVLIGHFTGAGDRGNAEKAVGNTVTLFGVISIILTAVLLILTDSLMALLRIPAEAIPEAGRYLRICFAGIPFITAYNLLSSIFRGAGDSKTPMYFVAAACAVNIALDLIFMDPRFGFDLGAAGAALGTTLSQTFSCLLAVIVIRRKDFGFSFRRDCLKPEALFLKRILKVGIPIMMQDGFIQVSFLIITMIANGRGLIAAAAVGVVEKLIGFLFLVPSAVLASLSAMTAQNIGAGRPDRAKRALWYGMALAAGYGALICLICQFAARPMIGLFTRDAEVIEAGRWYLYSYSTDCFFAALQFSMSGYFTGLGYAGISFISNLAAIVVFRVPGAILASALWPANLLPMGFAAPAGSLLSAVIDVWFLRRLDRKERAGELIRP